jgi:hypothetical protein
MVVAKERFLAIKRLDETKARNGSLRHEGVLYAKIP